MTDAARRRAVRAGTFVAVALTPVLVTPAAASAHGVGERADLPLPLWQVAWAAGAAIAISFAALGALWRRPRLDPMAEGRLMGSQWDGRLRGASIVGRFATLVIALVAIWAAQTGPTNPNRNLAPVAFYVVLWVGGQLASACLGDVWSAISPVDSIAAISSRIRRRIGRAPIIDDESPLPRWSHWPATAGVLGFLWLELAYHEPGSPRVIAAALVGVPLVLLIVAARRGRAWLRIGDPLGALFSLLAAMAPVGRDERGNLRRRLPVMGLVRMRLRPGTIALVLVTLGGTTFDGVTRTTFWGDVTANHSGWGLTALNTIGLVWFIGCVATLYVGATRLMARTGDEDPATVADRYVHSLVPIALGYTIAHYFSLLIFEGQRFLILLSDPAGHGWDVFGTASWRVNYRLLSPSEIAWVQIAAIVLGHLVAVVLAHDRALEHDDARGAIRGQYPLLAVMIVYTVGALFLLLNA